MHLPNLKKLSPLFTLLVFGFAVYAIYLELHKYSMKQIGESIIAIEPWKLVVAATLVLPGLLALACYDLVAARFFRLGIGWVKPLLTGLLGYTITNTTGHGVLVGAMLRLRIYPRWGVTGTQVGEVVSFGVVTYYMGLSFVTAVAFIFEGGELTDLLSKLPKVGGILGQPWLHYGVPTILLGTIALWFALISFRKRPISVGRHEFRLPGPGIGIFQLVASVADLFIASSVLYILLPAHEEFGWIAFIGIFSVVQFVALMSAVPGGIGVFTAIMLVVLGSSLPSESNLLASLITFRVLYYLIPFAIGGTTFLGLIARQNTHGRRQKNDVVSGT